MSNSNEGKGDINDLMATVTGVACDKEEARVRVMPKAMRVVRDKEGESSKATATATRVMGE